MCKDKAGKLNRDLYLLKSLFCRNGPEIRLYISVQPKQKNGNSEPLTPTKGCGGAVMLWNGILLT